MDYANSWATENGLGGVRALIRIIVQPMALNEDYEIGRGSVAVHMVRARGVGSRDIKLDAWARMEYQSVVAGRYGFKLISSWSLKCQIDQTVE